MPGPVTVQRTAVLVYPDQQQQPYRYMFEKIADKATGTVLR